MGEPWWTLSTEEVCAALESDAVRGLSLQQVHERRERYAANRLPVAEAPSSLRILIDQFRSVLVWVLIAACLIALLLGEHIDALAISVIVILNALLGFLQEWRAERSLAALRKLSSPKAKVLRDGVLHSIASAELIPGDLVFVEAGDRIPADGRLLGQTHLQTQEAPLTGESLPVKKTEEQLADPHLATPERRNMVFMGSDVVSGKGSFVVTECGLDSELGKIAKSLESSADDKTPLQQRLNLLGSRLVMIFLAIVSVIFALGLVRGLALVELVLVSLSLAVAAVPEGLPAVVTIALAFGVRRMVRRKSLVRRLASVETLGSATVICTDKTGTLTQNEMAVREIWIAGESYHVTGVGYVPDGHFEKGGSQVEPPEELLEALKIAVLCNDAQLMQENGNWQIVGDPTEAAMIVAARKAGINKELLEHEAPIIDELPFDSERRRMNVVRQGPDGPKSYVKGAPDVLLSLAATQLVNGTPAPLSDSARQAILEANAQIAAKAMRVLAVATGEEGSLCFVGLIGMIDPPRTEALEAIKTCRQAGIRTVMITGDHKATASAIAAELGIEGKAIEGAELEQMSDELLEQCVADIGIYARASAQHKLRVVRAWKKRGDIVAMTGDGVNDAPAVKEADIGVAMGITGSDVTKEASDMVILDDNFASIVNAVEEGRGIYANIRKFVGFLLASNFAEILVVFVGMLLAWKDPSGANFITLLPAQLLWINLLTDGLPAIALGVDPVDPQAMQEPPRDPREHILPLRDLLMYGSVSAVMASGTLGLCYWGLQTSAELAHTLAFTTLVLLELVKVQVVRASYHMTLFSNPWLIGALLASLGLQVVVIYTPSFQSVFGTVSLGLYAWSLMLGCCLIVWAMATAIVWSARRSSHLTTVNPHSKLSA